MKIIIQIIILSNIIYLFSACSYDFEKSGDRNLNEVQDANLSLSYAKINDLVLAPRCLGCHSGTSQPLLTNYSQVFAKKEKIFEETIASNKMPKGKPLTNGQYNALKAWLEAGAPENADVVQNPPEAPPSKEGLVRLVTWEQVRTKVIEKSCTSCHYAGNTSGISSYEDYETVKATVGTIFYTVAIQPVMPPAPNDWPEDQPNPNQLTRDQKDLISAWIVDGMLP